jgi:DNA topoisomerase VI subunit B
MALDFFTEANLSTQIGTERRMWGIAVLKEMIDNALDACETASISPAITVTVTDDGLAVEDNGPGIPRATLEASLDFSKRVSANAYYVSPSRGRLGNALKVLWGVCAVVGKGEGHADIATGAFSAGISISLDPVLQHPDISITYKDKTAESGTFLKLVWPDLACSLEDSENGPTPKLELERVVYGYHVLNPHAAFTLRTPWADTVEYLPVGAVKRWDVGARTSPHWYTAEAFRDLLYATVRGNKSLKVRDFARVFHGVTGLKLKAIESAGVRINLPICMVAQDDAEIRGLLMALKSVVGPVRPGKLGKLGRDHVAAYFASYGLSNQRYQIVCGEYDGVPYLFEVGFAYHDHKDNYRQGVVGMNWSPALDEGLLNPVLRAFGRIDAEPHDPIVFIAHLIYPAAVFTDRAKSKLALPGAVAYAIQEAVCKAGDGWRKLKAKAEREGARAYREAAQKAKRSHATTTLKEAVESVLPEAYEKASGGGAYPVLARQLFYVTRSLVAQIIDRPLGDEYFRSILRHLRINNPEMFGCWDILSDGRGHGTCPYTGKEIALGTDDVRSITRNQGASYIPEAKVPEISINIAANIRNFKDHYSCALYIEKEGYNQLLNETGVLRRYGVYLISGKGNPTDAARDLVASFSQYGLPTLALHDFDYPGLLILKSLMADSDTYKWKAPPYVIDLALRLTDVQALGLESEPCTAKNVSDDVLDAVCATDEEKTFLFQRKRGKKSYSGGRVELNAMTTPQLIDFLEDKFEGLGLTKPVPNDKLMEKLYTETIKADRLQRKLREFLRSFKMEDAESIEIPPDLRQQVIARIDGNDMPWDEGAQALLRH